MCVSLRSWSPCTHAGGEPLEVLQRLGAQLVEDSWKHFRDLFRLGLTGHGECVGGQRGLDLGVIEVNDRAVVFHHVDLLNAGDVIHLEIYPPKKGYHIQSPKIVKIYLIHIKKCAKVLD